MTQAKRRDLTPVLMLLPALTLILAVVGYPIVAAVLLSLERLRLGAPREFVGLANYLRLAGDSQVWQSMAVTAVFVVGSLLTILVLGFLLALFLYQNFPGRRWLRALILVPWALAPVVNGIMWKSIYSPGFGPLNDSLARLGLIRETVNWLLQYPMQSLILAYAWKVLPFPTLILLAGLEGIPVELYEAAAVDGATSTQRFRHITLPMLKTVTFLAVILALVDSLKVFAIVDVLTKGGPARQTMVFNYTIFLTAFRFLDFGYGAALSFVLTAIILILVFLYMRAARDPATVAAG